jgi:hypothetical protein
MMDVLVVVVVVVVVVAFEAGSNAKSINTTDATSLAVVAADAVHVELIEISMMQYLFQTRCASHSERATPIET